MSAYSILVVDDSRDLLELLRRQLKEQGWNPFVSDNVMDAIDILENTKVDLLITDINMPEISGEQLIRYVSERIPNLPTIVMTGFPDVNSAINVMKLGALEYLIKPFSEKDLVNAINKVMLTSESTREDAPNQEDFSPKQFQGLIGASSLMQELYYTIDRVKSNKATILISGESGTGKELVARAIHYNSDFATAPFVPVNCGAIPDQLLESELFGHIKGSFTGAITNRAGFFQAANGGTLFLDEISNTTLEVQAKLLRAIQEKEVTAIGSTKPQKIELRIITASNVNLEELIEQGKFREDLYYRLNVISLEIPPLRKRGEDILLLVRYFNNKYSKEMGKDELRFERNVLKIFESYQWPGNVRELENFIQRIVVMHDGLISVDEIPEYMKNKVKLTSSNKFETLAEMEKKYIQKVLISTKNNKSEAARILNIDRKTLRDKLK